MSIKIIPTDKIKVKTLILKKNEMDGPFNVTTLAEQINWHRVYVSNVINNYTDKLSPTMFMKIQSAIAKGLGLTVEEIQA